MAATSMGPTVTKRVMKATIAVLNMEAYTAEILSMTKKSLLGDRERRKIYP
jgi:hypothetical protein